jgi:SSS family solute:Na+ symporter
MKFVAGYLYEYLQNVQSLIAPSIAAVFIMGVFSKRTTGKAGYWGLVIGFVLGMFRLVLMIFRNYLTPGSVLDRILQVNWLHYCIFLFFLSLVIMWIISLFTKRPEEEQIKGLVYGLSTPEQIAETRASWNKWDVIHSLIIIGVVVWFYVYFW